MQRLFIILTLCLLVGCASWAEIPSVCDNMEPGQSVLCDIAKRHDIRLETAGDLILVVNLRAIQAGAYSKEDALYVFGKIETALEAPVTAADLRGLVLKYVKDYPELILLSPYLALVDVPEPVTDADREMLEWWIDYNREWLK